jgi:hypothetical protein
VTLRTGMTAARDPDVAHTGGGTSPHGVGSVTQRCGTSSGRLILARTDGGSMYTLRPGGLALLSLLYAVSAVLSVVAALVPATPRTAAPLLWVLAGVGAGGAAVLWLGRDRLGPRTVHVAVGVLSVFVGLFAWRASSPVGFLVLGPAVVALGLFSAHFLSRPAARAHLVFLVAVSTAGAAAAEPSGVVAPWLVMAAVVGLLVEAQAWTTGELRRAAGTDPLTGLANRRTWETEANRSLAHALRTGEPSPSPSSTSTTSSGSTTSRATPPATPCCAPSRGGGAASCGSPTRSAGTAATSSCSVCPARMRPAPRTS